MPVVCGGLNYVKCTKQRDENVQQKGLTVAYIPGQRREEKRIAEKRREENSREENSREEKRREEKRRE